MVDEIVTPSDTADNAPNKDLGSAYLFNADAQAILEEAPTLDTGMALLEEAFNSKNWDNLDSAKKTAADYAQQLRYRFKDTPEYSLNDIGQVAPVDFHEVDGSDNLEKVDSWVKANKEVLNTTSNPTLLLAKDKLTRSLDTQSEYLKRLARFDDKSQFAGAVEDAFSRELLGATEGIASLVGLDGYVKTLKEHTDPSYDDDLGSAILAGAGMLVGASASGGIGTLSTLGKVKNAATAAEYAYFGLTGAGITKETYETSKAATGDTSRAVGAAAIEAAGQTLQTVVGGRVFTAPAEALAAKVWGKEAPKVVNSLRARIGGRAAAESATQGIVGAVSNEAAAYGTDNPNIGLADNIDKNLIVGALFGAGAGGLDVATNPTMRPGPIVRNEGQPPVVEKSAIGSKTDVATTKDTQELPNPVEPSKTTFTTEDGSRYISTPEGATTRTKIETNESFHPLDKTFYVNEDTAVKLASLRDTPDPDGNVARVLTDGNKLYIKSGFIDDKLNPTETPTGMRKVEVPVNSQPSIGLYPVEVNRPKSTNGFDREYRSHIGKKITDVANPQVAPVTIDKSVGAMSIYATTESTTGRNIRNSPEINAEVRASFYDPELGIGTNRYFVQPNVKTRDAAGQVIEEKGVGQATLDVLALPEDHADPVTISLTGELLRMYSDAGEASRQAGDMPAYEKLSSLAMQLGNKLAQIGVNSGQTVQAFRMLKYLHPDMHTTALRMGLREAAIEELAASEGVSVSELKNVDRDLQQVNEELNKLQTDTQNSLDAAKASPIPEVKEAAELQSKIELEAESKRQAWVSELEKRAAEADATATAIEEDHKSQVADYTSSFMQQQTAAQTRINELRNKSNTLVDNAESQADIEISSIETSAQKKFESIDSDIKSAEDLQASIENEAATRHEKFRIQEESKAVAADSEADRIDKEHLAAATTELEVVKQQYEQVKNRIAELENKAATQVTNAQTAVDIELNNLENTAVKVLEATTEGIKDAKSFKNKIETEASKRYESYKTQEETLASRADKEASDLEKHHQVQNEEIVTHVKQQSAAAKSRIKEIELLGNDKLEAARTSREKKVATLKTLEDRGLSQAKLIVEKELTAAEKVVDKLEKQGKDTSAVRRGLEGLKEKVKNLSPEDGLNSEEKALLRKLRKSVEAEAAEPKLENVLSSSELKELQSLQNIVNTVDTKLAQPIELPVKVKLRIDALKKFAQDKRHSLNSLKPESFINAKEHTVLAKLSKVQNILKARKAKEPSDKWDYPSGLREYLNDEQKSKLDDLLKTKERLAKEPKISGESLLPNKESAELRNLRKLTTDIQNKLNASPKITDKAKLRIDALRNFAKEKRAALVAVKSSDFLSKKELSTVVTLQTKRDSLVASKPREQASYRDYLTEEQKTRLAELTSLKERLNKDRDATGRQLLPKSESTELHKLENLIENTKGSVARISELPPKEKIKIDKLRTYAAKAQDEIRSKKPEDFIKAIDKKRLTLLRIKTQSFLNDAQQTRIQGLTSKRDVLFRRQDKIASAVKERQKSFTPEDEAKLKKLIKVLPKLKEDTSEYAKVHKAIQDIDNKVKGKPAYTSGGLLAYWFSNILSNIGTHFANIKGNTLQQLFTPVAYTLAGKPGAASEFIKGCISAAGEASEASINALLTGEVKFRADATKTGTKNDFVKTGPAYIRNLGYVLRLLSAEDEFFYHTARDGQARAAAYMEAKNNGLSGEALRNKISQDMSNSTNNWNDAVSEAQAQAEVLKEADVRLSPKQIRNMAWEIMESKRPAAIREESARFAKIETFNHPPKGFLGQVVRGLTYITDAPLRIGGREIRPLKYVLPFLNVAGNIANSYLDYTPVGLYRAAHAKETYPAEWSKLGKYGKAQEVTKSSLQRRAELGKFMLGTIFAGTIYGIAKAYMDDKDPYVAVYGSGPNDAGLREQLRCEGWSPYSIKVGNTYVRYTETPLALVLGAIGSLHDNLRYNKQMDSASFSDSLSIAAVGMAGSFVDNSFLKNVSTLVQTLTDESKSKNLTNIIASMAQGFIPASGALRFINTAIADPITTKGDFWAKFVSGIPFVQSVGTKQALNAFGDPIGRTFEERTSILSRLYSSRVTDPDWRWLAETGYTIPDAGSTNVELSKKANPPATQERIQNYGAIFEGKLTPEERYLLTEKSGPDIRQVVSNFRSNYGTSGYQERVQEELNKAVANVRSRWKRDLFLH